MRTLECELFRAGLERDFAGANQLDSCQRISDFDAAISEATRLLGVGYDVPLCFSWTESESLASQFNHFVLPIAVRSAAGATELEIYDPWTGGTAWISVNTIRRNSLGPILNRDQRLTHFYAASPFAENR